MWTPIPLTSDYTRAATPARSPETNANNPNGLAGHPLNDRGQYITTNDGTSVNWHRYDPDGSSIPLPAGFSGRAIADNGRIVGIMANHATLVEPIGIAEDLNDRNPAGSPFSTLSTAEDINDDELLWPALRAVRHLGHSATIYELVEKEHSLGVTTTTRTIEDVNVSQDFFATLTA